jgi:hypothetical protein
MEADNKTKPIIGDINQLPRVNYMHVIPNSHFWTDLNQILATIEHHYQRMAHELEKHDGDEYTVHYVGEPLTKEYFLIGLNNSVKNGYKLKSQFKEYVRIVNQPNPVFISLQQMIEFVESKSFELKFDFEDFEKTIKNTLDCGLNLTNGLKMNRQDVYKRLDGERDYQDASWGHRRTLNGTPDEEKPVAEWINYMEFHIAKAKEKVYYLDTLGATAELRKIAALAVRAMEIHGCPEREGILNPATLTVEKPCCDSSCDCKK